MKKIVFYLLLGIAILLWGIVYFKPHPQTVVTPPTLLPIRTLKANPFTYTKSFIGSVQAIQSVTVVPYLSGFLKEVYIQAGEKVGAYSFPFPDHPGRGFI